MSAQDDFVAARRPDWSELDGLVGQGAALHARGGPTISRAAALYRALCTDLMRCRAARYTPDLTGYLDGLAARAHNALYGAEPLRTPGILRFFTHDFPATLRNNGRFFAVSCALFLVPFLIGLVTALASPELATEVIPASMLEGMRRAYSEGFNGGRSEAADMSMAGFYVYNNIGIAFRCFATGVLFGVGSMFFLVYNGLVTGTVVGYVIGAGHGRNILTFVAGHGAFELTAIVIAGAAGLRMGYALVDTGGRTRVGSLRLAAPDIARLVVGAACMLAIAAVIEGFWSPSGVPAPVKWVVAALFWIGVTLYLALAGRPRKKVSP
jgi:uncharacterized membrane protein SpoIIM required for sporulation